MFNIENFLKRFTLLTPPDDAIRRGVQEVLEKEIGVFVEKKNISIHNNIIYIKTKPLFKNEIFIKKQSILKELEKKFHQKTPRDIK
ncbi:MAG: hypothetical protein NUV49_01395 [Patescibacteria group bacterium]|nr:hypothetical protein [Patescibacteria group bacterium]